MKCIRLNGKGLKNLGRIEEYKVYYENINKVLPAKETGDDCRLL
jgi:hypothetical protein